MNPALIVHVNKASQVSSLPKIVKEGDSVFVRVISDKGGGRYEGLVSGVKVSFTSAKTLKTGSSFAATVKLQGNSIVLTPKMTLETTGGLAGETVGLHLVENSEISQILMALGLPADRVSQTLLQMSKQLEMRINPQLLLRLRGMALRFGGKEKLAAEVLMMLAQRDFLAEENEVWGLLLLLSGKSEDYDKLLAEKDDKWKKLLNKINSREGSWYLFPFEMIEYEDNKRLGNGCVRLLLENNQKIKLLNLSCNYKKTSFYFSLNYLNGKCEKIYMNVDNEKLNKDQIINHFEKKLSGLFAKNPLFKEIKVLWAEKDEIEGCASTFEELYSFGGEV